LTLRPSGETDRHLIAQTLREGRNRGLITQKQITAARARADIDRILGVYELNRIELLRDVFAWAYERSCARYAAVQRSLGEPDPFRMRYRKLLAEIVATILRGGMDRSTAAHFIQREADENAPREDRARLVKLAETEVMSLHEGNFARYRVRPSEYQAGRATWR